MTDQSFTQYGLYDEMSDRVVEVSADRDLIEKHRGQYTYPDRVQIWERTVSAWRTERPAEGSQS